MRNLLLLSFIALFIVSCGQEQDYTPEVVEQRGLSAVGDIGPTKGSIATIEVVRSFAGTYTAQSLAQRACSGQAAGASNIVNTSTPDCNPLDIMTPNFAYFLFGGNYDIAPGTTAYFGEFDGLGVPNEFWVQDYLHGHLQGLNNEGLPPPMAPGMTRTWVEDDFYQVIYEELPDSDGNYPNLGDAFGDNISTENLEFLRDQLSCEVLDVYFDQYSGNTAPDGYGYLLGSVQVEALQSFCGGARLMLVTVFIGHYVYTAPDFPTIN